MEEEEESNTSKKCIPKTRNHRGNEIACSYQYHHHHLLQNSYRLNYGFGFGYQNQYQNYPALLPLPPSIPVNPPFLQNQSFTSKTHLRKASWRQNNPPLATSSEYQVQDSSVGQARTEIHNKNGRKNIVDAKPKSLMAVAKRPDSGGVEGKVITLLANHFLVEFDPSQRIFHYDVEISPNPSKEIARTIKQKLVNDHSSLLSNAHPVYDGRRTLYSPIEFKDDRLECYISLPMTNSEERYKIFRVNIKLVSKFDGEVLSKYLNKGDAARACSKC
ncbi:hypothetical protein DH2020_049908 [Rehmannia glutinosa]|uniref:Protein argonaute N-terminal domain-containing protein n=1 Tax=Rehmannia glutinosa TaxID=99300 RepID=A0ABR0U2D0_REHGL